MKRIMRSVAVLAAPLVAAALLTAPAHAGPADDESWRTFTVLGVLGVTLGAFHTNEAGERVADPRAHRQVYRNAPSFGRFDEARRNHAITPPYYGPRRYDPRRRLGPFHSR